MMNINKVIVCGRLIADPEYKEFASFAVTNFRIAVNRRWKDSTTQEVRETACFIDVECYGRRAPLIRDYFKKGRPIIVEGYLKQNLWETKEGEKRSRHVIVLETFSFADAKPTDEEINAVAAAGKAGGFEPSSSEPARTAEPAPSTPAPVSVSAPAARRRRAAPAPQEVAA